MNVRIILVGTTHPGNIGAAARAMKNMGLRDLALVRPKYFPHADATARASGAEDLLLDARVADTLDAALVDCTYVAGASARSRTIGWPTMVPRDAAARLLAESPPGKAAIVFGPEKSGLTNEDLDRCHSLLTIPTDPKFRSLNLAMAVQVMTYELRQTMLAGDPALLPTDGRDADVPPATGDEMQRFFTHLEAALTASGFLNPDNPRQLMRRLRRLFGRALPDKNEINILRGILASFDKAGESDGAS